MSGGVDSSVSAALLKQQGYDVTGVFISTWQPDFMECNQDDDRRDAKRVAAHLDIPFVMLDAVEEYKQGVVDYMIAEYRAGRTPNPDIMCNKHVKFGVFFDKAMEHGADFIATGHYVQIQSAKCKVQNNQEEFSLLMGNDAGKDQSYFLWTLTQEHLQHTLFPVGEFEKSRVRELAEEFGLPNADKKDSQGLCFMGKLDVHKFLAHYIEPKSGDVLNTNGEIIGYHDGSHFLTLGQRHGFTVTKKTPDDPPYYIIDKDSEANTITVAHTISDSPTSHSQIRIANTNWIRTKPEPGDVISARLRYRQPLFEVTTEVFEDTSATFRLTEPQSIIPQGQSLVLYDGEECLGGGIITQ